MIKIKAKPVSVNAAYYMRNKKYNAMARSYRDSFLEQLQSDSNQKYLTDIRKQFDQLKHSLAVTFYFHVPKDKFFTKKGYVSRNSMDLDNMLKLPIDFLTHSKYPDRDNMPNLGIDDQFITNLNAIKTPSLDKNYYIFVKIEVITLIHDL